jgi:hypothetical protein
LAIVSVLLAVGLIARSLRRQAAEQEFARWFQVPPGQDLLFRDGWWVVEPVASPVLANPPQNEESPPAR